MNDIIDLTADKEFKLTARVAICAEAEHLGPLTGLSKSLELIELSIDETPPETAISNAQVVIMQVDPENPGSVSRIEQLKNNNPSLHLIAALPDVDLRITRKMIRLGIEDLVRIPFNQDEVMTCVLDVETRIDDDEARIKLAPVVAVMKSVGGCGASTIATHLAGGLASSADHPCSVCVVDLDLQLGSVAPMLGGQPRLSLLDLIEADARIDTDLLQSVVTKTESNVDVIAAPSDIIPVESIDGAKLDRIIRLLRQNYDLVVLDLPLDLTNWALATVMDADVTIIVAQLGLASLNQTKRRQRLLTSMGYDKGAIEIVLNRTSRKLFGTIDTGDAERALGQDLELTISKDDDALADAQSQGLLVWDLNKRGRLAKEFQGLADHIAGKVFRDE
ncbi:AAA family ATPase [Pontixanthobacter luteolus]|uniref:AAA family ATPase n=1 Tax=Pontixanthobacter luteolus TaxID=295089 RepID=UPI0023024B83|nr:AAA family ATPase [Pontixanthobacter luteolus]